MKKIVVIGVAAALLSACSSATESGSGPSTSAPVSATAPATPAVRTSAELVAAMTKAAAEKDSYIFHSSLVNTDGQPVANLDGSVSTKGPVMANVRRNDADGFNAWLLVGGKGYHQGDKVAQGYWQLVTAKELDALLREYSTHPLLRDLEAGAERATFVGREELTGTKTLKYTFVLDTAKTLAAVGKAPSKAMPATVDYTVWIDDQDRPRKASYELADLVVTTEYGWGRALELVAPADDIVIPADRSPSGSGG